MLGINRRYTQLCYNLRYTFFFIVELQKSRNARRYEKTRVKMIDNKVKVKMLECVFCCV